MLYLLDQYFKTNEEVGSLYSVEDLLKVRLIGGHAYVCCSLPSLALS